MAEQPIVHSATAWNAVAGRKLRRLVAALLACVAASALALVATPSPASAIPYTSSMPIINVGSNKCFQPVEPSGHVEWAGVPVQQRTCFLDFRLQYWRFESLGYVLYNEQAPWWCVGCIQLGAEGFFIRNEQTRLCLDVRDGSTSDWAVVQQWTCRDRNARSMVWYVQPGDYPDSFKIRNFNSDLCLDVAWGSSYDFAQIQQYHCTSYNPAQNFYQGLWPR